MNIQRLRNLTTGRLHTQMEDIYEDLGFLMGDEGLMTHMLPRTMRAVEPWLREKVQDARFWDDKYDTTHTGDFDLPTPTSDEQKVFWERYQEQPNPLEGKTAALCCCTD